MKVKIRFSKKLKIFILVAILVASLAIFYILFMPKPVYFWNYYGVILEFRQDLRDADKIPAYPGETQVYLDTIHPLVKNVTIAFKDAGEENNPHYIVEEIEIITKMTLAYRRMLAGYPGLTEEDMPTFDAMPIEQYANLPGKIQNPIIALVHPIYANETAVRNEGHITYISGTTFEDFDLAATKFLMIALGLELPE